MNQTATSQVELTRRPLHRYYHWELLFLLCLAFFFHQGDRAIFGVVISEIRADLGLTDSQLGLVGSVLFFTMALMMPLAGIVGDRLKKNWIITCSLIFWSSATLFTGCVQGLFGLILLRSVATAGGEAFYSPAAYPLMARFHQRTRALALSLHQAALYVGVMTSGFLGGWIAQNWGWRSAFYAFGSCGIILGLVFIFRLKDAPEQPAPAGQASNAAGLLESMGIIFRVPSAALITAGLTAIVFVNNGFVVWAPEFLREKQDLSLALAGGYSMFWHHLPALVGISFGGPLSDRWALKRPSSRLELQIVAMALGVPSIVLMGLAPNLLIACVGLAAFGFFRGLYESNTHAAMFQVVEPRYRASAVAIAVMLAFLVGSTSPWFLGKCRELFAPGHGLSYGFAMMSSAYLIGAVAIATARFVFFHRDRITEAAA
ncbi:MAG: MFS transporter [Thermoguttaceae bacterium]